HIPATAHGNAIGRNDWLRTRRHIGRRGDFFAHLLQTSAAMRTVQRSLRRYGFSRRLRRGGSIPKDTLSGLASRLLRIGFRLIFGKRGGLPKVGALQSLDFGAQFSILLLLFLD